MLYNNIPLLSNNTADKSVANLECARKRMYVPTSKADIKYMLNDKVKVVTYLELNNYNSLDELLEPYMNVVILYPSPPPNDEIGHWCCIFANTGLNRIEFFDSYGCYIDDKVEDFNDNIDPIHESHQLEPKLLELILSSKYADGNIHYNEITYQSTTKATSTCGLWVVMRIKNKHLNEYEFAKVYHDLPTQFKIMPDLMVSSLICNLFPEMRVS